MKKVLLTENEYNKVLRLLESADYVLNEYRTKGSLNKKTLEKMSTHTDLYQLNCEIRYEKKYENAFYLIEQEIRTLMNNAYKSAKKAVDAELGIKFKFEQEYDEHDYEMVSYFSITATRNVCETTKESIEKFHIPQKMSVTTDLNKVGEISQSNEMKTPMQEFVSKNYSKYAYSLGIKAIDRFFNDCGGEWCVWKSNEMSKFANICGWNEAERLGRRYGYVTKTSSDIVKDIPFDVIGSLNHLHYDKEYREKLIKYAKETDNLFIQKSSTDKKLDELKVPNNDVASFLEEFWKLNDLEQD